ncbi:hypothetical protein Y032_0015g2773 [Ancylostoma ceylanicum]|uniref:Uncharacterized protein n=1 Tax=Ancylostoma ceylanicum TaxID=53326 RepID=A0A016V8B0_9BILA|nr:hypothetical protein Y032_0015g2773 [Ancylostoma ceylanicum]
MKYSFLIRSIEIRLHDIRKGSPHPTSPEKAKSAQKAKTVDCFVWRLFQEEGTTKWPRTTQPFLVCSSRESRINTSFIFC